MSIGSSNEVGSNEVEGDTHSLHNLIKNSIVLDLETSIVSTAAGGSPSPWHGAYVVASNYKWNIMQEDEALWGQVSKYDNRDPKTTEVRDIDSDLEQLLWGVATNGRLLVGHNLKFDLGHIIHLMRLQNFPESIIIERLSKLMVWDTMIAEFYLSNQELVSPGLEKCCAENGIAFVKDETVTESFKLGIGADQIDKETLLKYLDSDVLSTARLFKNQLQRAVAIGGPAYVEYLIQIMGASVTTCISESNGMRVNSMTFCNQKDKLGAEVETLEKHLNSSLQGAFLKGTDPVPVATSPQTISKFLYGGKYFVTENIQVMDEHNNPVVYKSGAKKGQVKRKKIKKEVSIPASLSNNVLHDPRVNTGSTDDDALKNILLVANENLLLGENVEVITFVEDLIRFRGLKKSLTTYYKALEKHMTINTDHNVMIHTNYNHAIAATKRLTSSKPNFQNMNNKDKD